MGAPYIYDISRLRVKDLHSATYIYVVRRLRVNFDWLAATNLIKERVDYSLRPHFIQDYSYSKIIKLIWATVTTRLKVFSSQTFSKSVL